ncbi:unnamed protein product, partial [Tetraodon nigroviridis]
MVPGSPELGIRVGRAAACALSPPGAGAPDCPAPMGEPLPGSARSAGGAETLAARLGCRALSGTSAAMTSIRQQQRVCV